MKLKTEKSNANIGPIQGEWEDETDLEYTDEMFTYIFTSHEGDSWRGIGRRL